MILLALGSNLGDREDHLARARAALEAVGVRILRASRIVETPAMLPTDAPADWNIAYLNQVLSVATAHPPEALLACAKSIEAGLGRRDRGRWGPREIDIDVLAYHAELRATPMLTLPHPGIPERRFVLEPLADIAPDWRHPTLGRTAREMLA